MHATSDVSGQAQSPELYPARPEAGLGSGFQWAWAWLKVQTAQSPGLKPGPHNQWFCCEYTNIFHFSFIIYSLHYFSDIFSTLII